MIRDFVQLCAIPSPGGRERQVADVLTAMITALGLSVEEDDAGAKIPGDCGNLLVRIPGSGPGPTLLLSAHMDTVAVTGPVVPVVENEYIRSDGTTILGADDKAGIVAILEAVRVLQATGEPHPPLELLFTVQEEGGLKGAKAFQLERLQAKMGYVLDASGPAGTIIVSAPSQNNITATIQGRAAHAGIAPEEGISAIEVAAQAVQMMKLGRIDEWTTANLGKIQGGTATNIVPERVLIHGEARSRQQPRLDIQTAHMIDCFQQAAALRGAKADVQTTKVYAGFELTAQDPVVALAMKAAEELGVSPTLAALGGGSDANIFNEGGLPTATLGIGMQKVHTPEEFIRIDDLIINARYLLAIIRLAGRK